MIRIILTDNCSDSYSDLFFLLDKLCDSKNEACHHVPQKDTIGKSEGRVWLSPPKEGKAITIVNSRTHEIHSTLILKELGETSLTYHVQKRGNNLSFKGKLKTGNLSYRPVTPCEIRELTSSLEKNGYKWNLELKKIELIIDSTEKHSALKYLSSPNIKMLIPRSLSGKDIEAHKVHILHNANKCMLGYFDGTWLSYPYYKEHFQEANYHLVPCKIEELKAGDTIYYSMWKYNSKKAKLGICKGNIKTQGSLCNR